MPQFEKMEFNSSFRKSMRKDIEPIQLVQQNILSDNTTKRVNNITNESLFVVPWQQSHEYK